MSEPLPAAPAAVALLDALFTTDAMRVVFCDPANYLGVTSALIDRVIAGHGGP